MRSLIIIEVEHGETTDPLDEYLDIVPGTNEAYPHVQAGLRVLNYSVRVDLPACFVLEGGHAIPSEQDLADAYKCRHPFKRSTVEGWENYCIEPTDEDEECGWGREDHNENLFWQDDRDRVYICDGNVCGYDGGTYCSNCGSAAEE